MGGRGTRFLVVGLGNPGRQYDGTPHNIGGESVALLARELGVGLSRRSQQSRWNTVRLPVDEEAGSGGLQSSLTIHLARPAMYMNECGRAVRSLVKARGVDLSQLLVVWDHMDLPLGQLRLRRCGGTGGHNGLRSIANHLGTPDFPRLAVGVGRPPGRMDPASYVLRRFSREDLEETVRPAQVRAGQAVVYWLRHGIDDAMNLINPKH